MIKRIKKGLSKRKVKLFLLFLICSSLAWFVSKLSETYTSTTTFDLVFDHVPDSLLLTKASRDQIDAKIDATGFQFLWFNFKPKKVYIDLSVAAQSRGRYYVPQKIYTKQIDRQIGSMTLKDIDRDTLFFSFHQIYEKRVPIISTVEVQLGQNFLIDGVLRIKPDSITIKGPNKEIDTIKSVKTLGMVLPDVTEDFSQNVGIQKWNSLKYTTFSEKTVKLSAVVFRFSEQVINVPVKVINLPDNASITTFPTSVEVVCKASISALKELSPERFDLVADFAAAKVQGNNTLQLELLQQPKNLYSAEPKIIEVEYILKRE